jgi:diguanylate cyclase (GGDEF)-like protein
MRPGFSNKGESPVSTTSIPAATMLAALAIALLYAGWTIHRLRVRLANLTHAASHDPLTCLPNRIHAQWLFSQRAADQLPTVVALLDLDEFKQVNDSCGHQAGDQLLATVADRLATAANRYGGHAARLAGDEFLLLLPVPVGDPVEPVACILAEITTPVHLATNPQVTHTPHASAGITIFDGVDGTWTSVLRRADIACYHAKARGGGYEVFQPGMSMPRPAAPAQRRGPRLRDQRQREVPA